MATASIAVKLRGASQTFRRWVRQPKRKRGGLRHSSLPDRMSATKAMPRTVPSIVASLLVLSVACFSAPIAESQVPVQNGADDTEQRLTAIKANLMSADYRADLAQLARLHDEALPFVEHSRFGHLAHYWAGFASWRIAINGANEGMGRDDLMTHLTEAVTEFEASIQHRADFADSYAAAASALGWLVTLRIDNPVPGDWERSSRLLKRATELESDNPRVLWVVGGTYLFTPAQYGGDPRRAIETYRQVLKVAADPTNSPLPDWGKPEALMALAFAHLMLAVPDLGAADEEARAALRMEPEWSYVRDILLPQIEAQRKKSSQ